MITSEIDTCLSEVSKFKGTFSRNNIPLLKQRPVSFVVNTDSVSEPGEHWVSINLLEGGYGEYFDPFGLPPLHKDFVSYMSRACPKGWCWSKKTLQNPTSKLCGLYCIKFIKARDAGLSYKNFLKFFTSNLPKNDLLLLNEFRSSVCNL